MDFFECHCLCHCPLVVVDHLGELLQDRFGFVFGQCCSSELESHSTASLSSHSNRMSPNFIAPQGTTSAPQSSRGTGKIRSDLLDTLKNNLVQGTKRQSETRKTSCTSRSVQEEDFLVKCTEHRASAGHRNSAKSFLLQETPKLEPGKPSPRAV